MEAVRREVRARQWTAYGVYRHVLGRCLDACDRAQRREEASCLFRVPAFVHGFPRYDPGWVARLVRRTLETRYGYGVSVDGSSAPLEPLLVVAWGYEPVFRRNQATYDEVVRLCRKRVETYVQSREYRRGRVPAISFRVPLLTDAGRRVNAFVAAEYARRAMEAEGFRAELVDPGAGAGEGPWLCVAWDPGETEVEVARSFDAASRRSARVPSFSCG